MTVRLPVRALLLACALSLQPALAAEAVSPQALSGDYRLYFKQKSKDCGKVIEPIDTEVTLRAVDGKLKVQFPSGFLGITVLEADYDGSRNVIIQEFEQRVDLGPTAATLKLTLRARIRSDSNRVKIDYTVVFDKIADDPAWNCRVVGRGWATKI